MLHHFWNSNYLSQKQYIRQEKKRNVVHLENWLTEYKSENKMWASIINNEKRMKATSITEQDNNRGTKDSLVHNTKQPCTQLTGRQRIPTWTNCNNKHKTKTILVPVKESWHSPERLPSIPLSRPSANQAHGSATPWQHTNHTP